MHSKLHAGATQRPVSSDDWYAAILAGGYKGVIFDCDGTLVNSGAAHFAAFRLALRAQGHEMEGGWYAARTGLDRRGLLTAFAAEQAAQLDIDRAIAQSIAAYIADCSAVSEVPEIAHLVRKLGQNFPMAVGTNAETSVATASLRATNLLGYFRAIASVSDNLPPKPAPSIFLRAAGRLGLEVSTVLVFEDSPQGVNAAKAAGLDVIEILPDALHRKGTLPLQRPLVLNRRA